MVYSFLLVNFNMWGLLERCIREIETGVDDDRYEILIADNSTDERFRVPDDFEHPAVTVTRVAENRGWVDALNRVLPAARGEYVIVMHPDVTLAEGCIPALRSFLESNPRAGVVGPNLVYPNGSSNAIRLQFPRVSVEARRLANIVCHILFHRRPLRDEVLWDHVSDTQADMVMSVLMMFRRDALAQIGLVCGGLWTYYANDWLCGRARSLGWTCHYVAAAGATHWERYSPPGLYSDADASAYKRDPVPVSDRMCRDRFTFLREFYSRPVRAAFSVLMTLENLVHIAAQLKPGRGGARLEAIRKYASTIAAAWARPQSGATEIVPAGMRGESGGVRPIRLALADEPSAAADNGSQDKQAYAEPLRAEGIKAAA
jgi:GT2 family glycosyltransferase